MLPILLYTSPISMPWDSSNQKTFSSESPCALFPYNTDLQRVEDHDQVHGDRMALLQTPLAFKIKQTYKLMHMRYVYFRNLSMAFEFQIHISNFLLEVAPLQCPQLWSSYPPAKVHPLYQSWVPHTFHSIRPSVGLSLIISNAPKRCPFHQK